MATTPTISSLFRDAGRLLRARFETIRTTNPHPGEKGAEVEDVLRTFLNEHLPQRFNAGCGIVLDTENALSKQLDVIIYDALSSPLYRYGPRTQIVPVEAVVCVIEVKSRLTKAELEDAYEKIASCKRLKKRPLASHDRDAGRPGTFEGTTGVIFAFDSAISPDTISGHVKELNERHPSSEWPEMIVVLDSCLVTYAFQYPGMSGIRGTLMSLSVPSGWQGGGPPPWCVHLVVHKDAEFTLNRFFVSLLTQLTFYPYRSSVPPFSKMLEGSDKEVMTWTAYQFDMSRELKPAPEGMYIGPTGEQPKVDRQIEVSAMGRQVAVIQRIPWQDAAVLRFFGAQQVIHSLARILLPPHTHIEAASESVWLTTLLPISFEDYKRWPRRIEKEPGLQAKLVRT